MAPLTDPTLLLAYRSALANRRFNGYVNWTDLAQTWVRRELPGVTPEAVVELICEHVWSDGEIDQIRETRPEWSEHDFHYDVRLAAFGRRIYIETRLQFDEPGDPDDPIILIANINDA